MTERDGGTVRDFEEKYLRLRSEAARSVREAAMGSDVPNGYTGIEQADHIAERLRLSSEDILLDLGSGRGWPGGRIAQRTGCRVVSTDLPLVALGPARRHWDDALGVGRMLTVCADGRLLPFRDRAVHAVTHADVLC
ncbi:MAG: hypothetical protein AAF389_04470 [Gemmatimonadota bacterium]